MRNPWIIGGSLIVGALTVADPALAEHWTLTNPNNRMEAYVDTDGVRLNADGSTYYRVRLVLDGTGLGITEYKVRCDQSFEGPVTISYRNYSSDGKPPPPDEPWGELTKKRVSPTLDVLKLVCKRH